MSHNPPVTGLNSIIERSKAFIAYLLHLQAENEHIIASAPIALLPDPRTITVTTAATWERYPDLCPICGQPMTKYLFRDGYFCTPCDQACVEATKKRLETGKVKALFPDANTLARRVTSGVYSHDMRHDMQESVVKSIIASMETVEELPPLTPAMQAAFNQPPTTPPVERDIEQVSTPQPVPQPQPTPQPTPTTPIPEAREHLFADIPQEAEEEEDETTEKRPIVRRVRRVTDTIQIPAMDAEAILLDMMHGEISPQSTGETERIDNEQKMWML